MTDFERLYNDLKPRFIQIARTYVRNESVAEDLVADSFMVYYQHRDLIAGNNIPGYIYATVKSRCLNWLRQQKHHAEKLRDLHDVQQRLQRHLIVSLESDQPDNLLFSEVSEIIERQLQQLPEITRRVFIAHRFDEMTYAEIEKLYGLSAGQVQYEVRNAKRALRRALQDYIPLLLWLLG